MEYKKAFLSRQIDFSSSIGSSCPICGRLDCYRQITPYWRYAIELFPVFKKQRIPISRFVCTTRPVTFSLLPLQLIPYLQYTVCSVIGTLLLAYRYWQSGQRGFFGATEKVDPDSFVTPWLVSCWLKMVIKGFQRSHAVLSGFYDLSNIRTTNRTDPCKQAAAYFVPFGLKSTAQPKYCLLALLRGYSRATKNFLFGTPSQYRV